jgi:predicted ATPase/DNA-binding winged helix-turn-helix (wHTH) protein
MSVIAFGPFVLDPGRRQLTRNTTPVPLEGRPLDILIHLAAHMGQVVPKRTLMQAVWPGRIVEENNLAVHISALRRLLGTAQDGRPIIQTVPGRGYMLVADTIQTGPGLPSSSQTASMPGPLALAANSFVGRALECDALSALVAPGGNGHRLVTIAAGGGLGKTRLALHVAAALAGGFRDGVHVAELASVRDPAQAAAYVATLFALGGGARPIVEQITLYLRDRQLLLVLDNCEHLVTPVAHLAAAILERCPGVSLIATSREPLGVPGEHVFRLQPLPVPVMRDGLSPDDALASGAIRLFVDRAADAVPGFALDAASLPAIVDICTRLDGIALAIEMAVPRLRVLAPAQLAARLRESLDFLTTPNRTAPARHRTLRAVLDWSHALLPEGEQALLRRLSIFAGPVDVEAVLAVARTPDQPELDLLDQLAGLVDKSLVVAEPGTAGPRYRLLETVRDYARERLAESGETGLHKRHAQHYAAVFEALAAAWPTAHTQDWQPLAAAEAGELRAALAWCFGPDGDLGVGLHLTGATAPAWWDLPGMSLREARYWFDCAAARLAPDTPPAIAARIWFGKSWRDMRHDDVENYPAAERAVALFRQTGDREGLAAALWRSASSVLARHPPAEVGAKLDEAEHLLRQGPPGKWLGLCLVRLGDLRARNGQFDTGLAAYAEALAIATATGHIYGMTNAGSNMADLLHLMGRAPEALAQLRRLHATLPLGPRTPLTATMAAHLAIGGFQSETLDAIAEVVGVAPPIGFSGALARTLEPLALLRVAAGDAVTAARLAGYARTAMPAKTRWAVPRLVYERLNAALAVALSDTERYSLLQQGAAWQEETAVTIATTTIQELAQQMRPGTMA